ncbi:MAG TPA: Xaa-Pro dipeptidyl-peptidase [Jiangellaceae bacterium]
MADDVGPIFVDGQAQIVPEFQDQNIPWIREELWVETEFDSDGDGALDRVHVTLARPGPTEDGLKVPVVYQTSPYYAGSAPLEFWNVNHELGQQPPPRGVAPEPSRRNTSPIISRSHENYWVPRGFAVVHSESPGTGLSQGCASVGGPNESLAPKAVIDWLNGRATGYTTPDGDETVEATWTTGNVGMTGTSYNGTLPIAAATTGVKGLEAIIPVAAISEWYQYYRNNGAVRAPGGFQGEDLDVLFDYINTRQNREYCIETVREKLMAEQDRATGDYSKLWDERNYMSDVHRIKAATLIWHGTNDWNVMPQQGVQLYEALKRQNTPAQIYLHQGGHSSPSSGAMPILNRWFTRYLWGHENNVEADPRAWIVREGDSTANPTGYGDYPNPDMQDVTLNLQEGGETTGGLTSLALPGTATESFVDAGNTACNAGWLATQPNDNRLLYTTPVLSDDLHISGVPNVTVRLDSSAARANLSAALVRLPWPSASECNSHTRGSNTGIVTRGWTDPTNRRSLYREDLLESGQFVDVTFNMQGTDKVVRAGERLGLMIFSTDNEFSIRPQPGTELTVDLAGTSLQLPVVGGSLAMPVCENVDERSTVVIGGVDSGVPNHALAGNCTINDHILDGEPWSNHGLFVDHVTDVSGELLAAGVIDHAERAALIRAASMSNVGR